MKKNVPLNILLPAAALFLITGCVAKNKHQTLVAEYQTAENNLEQVKTEIRDKDAQISELQQQLER